MRRARIREDILANMDKLPKRFAHGAFYYERANMLGCMCLFGWLCHVITGVPQHELMKRGWDFLQERYDADAGDDAGLVGLADGCIRAQNGDPRASIEAFLNRLEPLEPQPMEIG